MAYFLFLASIAVQLFAGGITLLFFAWDKRQAKLDRWRVPEKRLFFLILIGGWWGALIGQRYLRHKSQKLGFKIATYFSAFLHVAICIALFVWWQQA